MDDQAERQNEDESQSGRSRCITALADLPSRTLLDESALAKAIGVTQRTVRRMVRRHELPPPVVFAGRSTWMVKRVLDHFEARAERAARAAEREARRLESLATPHPPIGTESSRSDAGKSVDGGEQDGRQINHI